MRQWNMRNVNRTFYLGNLNESTHLPRGRGGSILIFSRMLRRSSLWNVWPLWWICVSQCFSRCRCEICRQQLPQCNWTEPALSPKQIMDNIICARVDKKSMRWKSNSSYFKSVKNCSKSLWKFRTQQWEFLAETTQCCKSKVGCLQTIKWSRSVVGARNLILLQILFLSYSNYTWHLRLMLWPTKMLHPILSHHIRGYKIKRVLYPNKHPLRTQLAMGIKHCFGYKGSTSIGRS